MRRRGSPALRFATCVALAVAGSTSCAKGGMDHPGDDAAPPAPDAPAHHPDAAALLPDAPTADAGCAINTGVTPAIDGVNDLADYPSAQLVPLYAPVATGDAAAVAWDRANLYLTVQSSAFASAYEPLHVYLQAGTAPLAAAAAATGKEYSNLVPALPFTATHLAAARRVDDAGSGPYDAVFLPGGSWTAQQMTLAPGANVYVSADQTQLSLVVPWSALGGCPTALRLSFHVVHAVTGNEWKDVAPTTATPWQAPGGGYYEIDLTGATAVSGWSLH